MERRLCEDLRAAGYDVMNDAKWSFELNDDGAKRWRIASRTRLSRRLSPCCSTRRSGTPFDYRYRLHGHPLWVSSIDLAKPWPTVRKGLDRLAQTLSGHKWISRAGCSMTRGSSGTAARPWRGPEP